MDAKKYLIVDAAALVVYAMVANPVFTGIPVHEWIGIGLFVLFVAHTAQHYDWIVETLRSRSSRHSWQRRANLIVDALIVIAFMVCAVSGLLVSGTVLASIGMYADGYYFWNPLHAASAKVLFALLMVHIVLHARMVLHVMRNGESKDEPSGRNE